MKSQLRSQRLPVVRRRLRQKSTASQDAATPAIANAGEEGVADNERARPRARARRSRVERPAPAEAHQCRRLASEDQFEANVNALDAWVRKHGNGKLLPWRRRGCDGEERRLSNFLCEQRKALKRGGLSESRRRLLLRVPGMHINLPRWGTTKVGNFNERADALEAWVRGNAGILPRLSRHAGPEEKLHARFLNKLQPQAATLPLERRNRLARVPGMAGRLQNWIVGYRRPRTFEASVDALKAWVLSHGLLPSRMSAEPEALALAKFLCSQQQAHAKQLMLEDRRQMLLQVPGMAQRMERWNAGGPALSTEEDITDHGASTEDSES